MSGREDDDVFWESWRSAGKRKRKKNSKKLRTGRDDDANESQKKKKRCSKVNEAVAGGRERKKKEKKKKSVEACVCHRRAAAASTHTPAQSPPHAKKKLRRKKVVAFDLSPFCVRVKRPEFVSWSPQLPQREGEGRSKARWAEPSQSQTLDDEDNSQDLFITQKTFRASPSESASEQMEPQAVHTTEEEEEEEEAGPSGRREERKMKTALIGEEECSYKRVNPYLATPPGLSVPQRCSRPPRAHRPRPLNAPPTASTSTQTENFFTSQFSSFLSFCQWRQQMMSRHDAQPLDLSLRPARLSTGVPGESPPSPPSAEATASSEDNEPLSRSSKPDLTQVRAVQMRLNESFFFKTKGDGHSPRAESPLMKLSQGRGERKSRKNH